MFPFRIEVVVPVRRGSVLPLIQPKLLIIDEKESLDTDGLMRGRLWVGLFMVVERREDARKRRGNFRLGLRNDSLT